MREIKGAVFDADGTLFDSMGLWDRAGEIYLRRKGIRPGEDTKEQLETILKVDENNSHYAVFNIHDRIRLKYGEGYGLRYESAVGQGTMVTIRIKTQP